MNTSKKTEELYGENLQIMRIIINRIHVGTSKLDVVRQVWKKSGKLIRNAPKKLRRGFIKAAIDIHCSNRMIDDIPEMYFHFRFTFSNGSGKEIQSIRKIKARGIDNAVKKFSEDFLEWDEPLPEWQLMNISCD